MGAVVKINFHGDELWGCREDDGAELVALKPIVEGMGLDWSAQLQRIKRDSILSPSMVMTTIDTATLGERESVALPLQLIPGFLFGIDDSRIPTPEVRAKVIRYKRECYDVLYNHFRGSSTHLEQIMEFVQDTNKKVNALYERIVKSKKPIPKESRDEARRTVHLGFYGHCPLTGARILDDNGEIIIDQQGNPIAEYDHARLPHQVRPEHVWLIEKKANRELGTGARSRDLEVENAFLHCQRVRARLAPPQLKAIDNPAPRQVSVVKTPPVLKVVTASEPEQPEADAEDEACRAGMLVQIIWFIYNDVATNKQIGEVYGRLRPDIKYPGASVRNGMQRYHMTAKIHVEGDYKDNPTLFRVADGYDKGVVSLTEAGIELAKRLGPIKLPD